MEYVPPDSDQKKEKSKAQDEANGKDWGEGQKLGKGAWKPSGITGAGGASIPMPPSRKSTTNQVEREETRSPSPDWGVDDDDMVDYDSD